MAEWHCSLFGITTLQVYIYYQIYPKDKLQNRIMVGTCHHCPYNQTKHGLGSPSLVCLVCEHHGFSHKCALCRIMDAFHLSMIINASYIYLVKQVPLSTIVL
jgi:hypothetical protein